MLGTVMKKPIAQKPQTPKSMPMKPMMKDTPMVKMWTMPMAKQMPKSMPMKTNMMKMKLKK